MSISEPFIRRPIGTSLLAAAVLLAGFTAYRALPVAPLPRVDFPTIQVSAALPGASPETMASSIATPLERRFGRIAGISEITSTSSLGSCSMVLQFDLDRDVDAAARDVQAAINAAGGDLPTNLPNRPTYRKVNPADSPILVVAMTSDTVPLAKIFDVANNILAQRIAQVDGVGQVNVGGGQQPAVRVQADPAALAGMGLTLADVRNMLASINVMEAKGSLQGPKQSYTMNINDQLYRASDYAKSILAYVNDAPVRLSDVARVFDDVENNRVAAWHNGKRAVLLIIRRQPEANIIDTIERVKSELPRLSTAMPPGVTIDVAMDRGTTIRASVADVETTLGITVILVVLVVFAFLRSPRATAIPSVAVPLSIVGTFAGMYALNYSLDNLSLMALTISTGFVVDDAIVVTENISRLLEEGKPRLEAALLGAKQVGFTIVSITASLLAVFIPILLMGGIVGRLFREFAMTLSLAIFVSAIVSLTLTPMMCALLLKKEDEASHGRMYRFAERALDGMTRGYERGLRWAFAHKRTMLFLTLCCVILNVALFIVVPKGLFPQQDTGLITGFSESSQDMSFLAMKTRQEAINAVLLTDPDIDHMVSFIGATNGNTGNTGTVFMQLRGKPERTATAEQVIARLRPKLAQVPGITVYLQAAQDIRVGGRSSRTQYQYTVQDANLAELRTWAPRLLKRLSALPQLKDVATDQQTSGLQANLWIDRDTASRMGISPAMIDDALYDAFGQEQVSTIFTEINEYRVVLEMKPELQDGPEALQRLYVQSGTAGPVPMAAFTRLDVTGTPLSVNHQGQFRSISRRMFLWGTRLRRSMRPRRK
jgi:multidrug efflux pump subunit AcrB